MKGRTDGRTILSFPKFHCAPLRARESFDTNQVQEAIIGNESVGQKLGKVVSKGA